MSPECMMIIFPIEDEASDLDVLSKRHRTEIFTLWVCNCVISELRGSAVFRVLLIAVLYGSNPQTATANSCGTQHWDRLTE
jgi:hypothetical protein